MFGGLGIHTFRGSNFYDLWVSFFTLEVRDSYVWLLVSLRLGVSNSYIWGLVFLRLEVSFLTFWS